MNKSDVVDELGDMLSICYEIDKSDREKVLLLKTELLELIRTLNKEIESQHYYNEFIHQG